MILYHSVNWCVVSGKQMIWISSMVWISLNFHRRHKSMMTMFMKMTAYSSRCLLCGQNNQGKLSLMLIYVEQRFTFWHRRQNMNKTLRFRNTFLCDQSFKVNIFLQYRRHFISWHDSFQITISQV